MPNFLDIEASGLHFDSWPVEVAVSGSEGIRSWLIRPEPTWLHWSEQAQALHGITPAFLEEQGMAAKTVARQLNQCLLETDGLVYSDAVHWDEDWLNTLFRAAGETREFHILSIDDLFDEHEQALFQTARQSLRDSGRYRLHRAAPDVALLCEAYRMVANSM
jgi:hypothetical protein